MTAPTAPTEWAPPFCSVDTGLSCPVCKEADAVQAREKSTYYDADAVEAYCSECHAELEVYSSVDIMFSDAEQVGA